MSNETGGNNCDHMIEEEVIHRVRPKLLQQSLSTFEGKARAWPDLPGRENPCHATKVSQTSGSGEHKRVGPRWSLPNNHAQTVDSFKICQMKENVGKKSDVMTKLANAPLRQPIPAVVEGKRQSRAAKQGWGVACNANQWSSPATMSRDKSVEPK